MSLNVFTVRLSQDIHNDGAEVKFLTSDQTHPSVIKSDTEKLLRIKWQEFNNNYSPKYVSFVNANAARGTAKYN